MSKPKIYEELHDEIERRVAEAVQAIEDAQVGEVFAWPTNSREPHRGLLCNGAAVSRTTYAKLFEAIGTTYGAGDGSSTFNLPNLTDKFIQGSGTAGTEKTAGLPNITGKLNIEGADTAGWWSSFASGALYVEAVSTVKKQFASMTSSYDPNKTFGLDASKSHGIYGASSTVQPPALTMRYYIKY